MPRPLRDTNNANPYHFRGASPIDAAAAPVERLRRADSVTLGIDTGHATNTPLADLATATEMARRDEPWIAVCEI
jgi:hypothetical protein